MGGMTTMERVTRLGFSALVVLTLAGALACVDRAREGRPAKGSEVAPPAAAQEAEPPVEPEQAAPPAETQEVAPPPETREADSSRRVLRSPLAGRWYDADPARLRSEIEGYLGNVEDKPLEGVKALILPHAGYRWSGQTAAHGVKQALGRGFRRVIVIGPSHGMPMENMASVPSATHYSTPLGEVPLDTDLIEALQAYPFFGTVPIVHEREHSVQIEVPLLQQAIGSFRLVPIVVGTLDPETARAMARVLLGRIDEHTLVVASSDFTHYGPNYGYLPFRDRIAENLKKLDMRAFEVLERHSAEAFRSFLRETEATICGREAIGLLLEMVPAETKVHLLEYDTSGRISGDFANSVSYLSIAFSGAWPKTDPAPAPDGPPALTDEDRKGLLRLARQTLEHTLKERKITEAKDLGIEPTEAMRWPRAAFVTLKKGGVLRGCIGGTYPSRPLYREVMIEALYAALRDNRFLPVQASELPALHIEISVLSRPERVDSHEEIVIGRHGIIMEKGGRRALFLPQVATEEGWDLTQTLGQLSNKMGLPAEAWREGASFLVFEAEVFGEPEKE